jgi:predicted PurR-regulated permease PerM
MVPVMSLLVPILVSAVIVFIASSVIHMVLPFHKNDIKRLPQEDEALEAIRRLKLPPGDYGAPLPASVADMKSPAFIEKRTRGPVLFMTVLPSGPPAMGTSLALWFLYSVIVSVFAAYIAGRALSPGVHYLGVFRFVGASAFMGYSLALMQNSIWWSRNWGMTLRSMLDGLLYALLTAGTFGWLWPR